MEQLQVDQPFVESLRRMAPDSQAQNGLAKLLKRHASAVHAQRGKVIVVGVCGDRMTESRLDALVHEVALMHSMGTRVVLVFDFQPQLEASLSERAGGPVDVSATRVVDDVALECAQEVAGKLRYRIEAAFCSQLPNTPMANSAVRLVSGTFIKARPLGVLAGMDMKARGTVTSVDTASILSQLERGTIVLLSTLAFSPTGDTLCIPLEEAALRVAVGVSADRLCLVVGSPAEDGFRAAPSRVLHLDEAAALLSSGPKAEQLKDRDFFLRQAVNAARAGIRIVNILPAHLDDSLLEACYADISIGDAVLGGDGVHIRQASSDDIFSILALFEAAESTGALVRRCRSDVEAGIEKYAVAIHDGHVVGCAHFTPYPLLGTAEVGAFTVSSQHRNRGTGGQLLRYMERHAKKLRLSSVFVLTTQTAHWFLRNGFEHVDPDWLPPLRLASYSWSRLSQVLAKSIRIDNGDDS